MRLSLLSLALLATGALAKGDPSTLSKVWPRCDSPIYCYGDLLKAVQLSEIFPDSKTFVDMPTKVPRDKVLEAWSKLQAAHPGGDAISKADLKTFVNDHFHPAGTEVVPGELPDFVQEPTFLNDIKDPIMRGFAQHLNAFWPNLTKRVDLSTICPDCETTLIVPKHDFIVPGGRFREFYYWDTYFTFQGMLLSGLYNTSRNMLEDFFEQVRTLGFIPNGARVYYKNRSQPPFLVQMVKSYIEFTKDESILKDGLALMDREWNFFHANTTIKVKDPKSSKTYTVNRYDVMNDEPRPEGYYPDYHTVEPSGLSPKGKAQLYAELASGAESGLDYTARWLNQRDHLNKSDPASILRSLAVESYIPVDLNALLYMNERQLAEWHSASGNHDMAEHYDRVADARHEAILALLWNADLAEFRDFNLTSHAHSEVWCVTNYWPFWARIYPEQVLDKPKEWIPRLFKPIRHLLDRYPGAIPTTELDTSLQWDFPNAWPPLTHALSQAVLTVYDDFVLSKKKPGKEHHQDSREKRSDKDISHSERIQRRRNDRRHLQSIRHSRIYRRDTSDRDHDPSTEEEDAVPKAAAAASHSSAIGITRPTNIRSPKVSNDPYGLYTMTQDIASHYMASAACGWYTTGGSVNGLLSRLPNVTDTGHMFEKFDATVLGAGGHGGEYEVQAGFGWTNGVAMWLLFQFGDELTWPENCPQVAASGGQHQQEKRRLFWR
ncbi:hypothetical protein DFQ26_006152 [Actinomortierella ambigua]|nr:hypothetical protein DFQ26_006152 [Actinomortierella ambigua]